MKSKNNSWYIIPKKFGLIFLSSFLFYLLFFQNFGCHNDLTEPDDDNDDDDIPPPAVFTTEGTQLISPDGLPIKLTGWRMDAGEWEKQNQVSQADFEFWKTQGLLGNAQAVEFWWSGGGALHVGERYPYKPGVYGAENLPKLLNAMRAIARSGSWIIPSIRVSFDPDSAIKFTKTGTIGWQGWAHHKKVIYNEPVVVEEGPYAGTYGNYRDRFFRWLDWIIPYILSDSEISSHIAYWEIWHFYGHRHDKTQLTDADHDFYFDEFIPLYINKFRKLDPNRLLGIGARQQFVMERLITRIDNDTWAPWEDKNWILVTGGYGFHDVIVSDKNLNYPWPTSCYNPKWIKETGEFDIQKFVRLTGRAVHSQEGPGLWPNYRTTPIREPQRSYVVGLLNLYNQYSNGFAWHAWPPSIPGSPDESELFNLLRTAFKGELIE